MDSLKEELRDEQAGTLADIAWQVDLLIGQGVALDTPIVVQGCDCQGALKGLTYEAGLDVLVIDRGSALLDNPAPL